MNIFKCKFKYHDIIVNIVHNKKYSILKIPVIRLI